MTILLNGSPAELGSGETVADALSRLGVDEAAAGIAVAVDGEVVPRRRWRTFVLGEGARVEVLTAMQGG